MLREKYGKKRYAAVTGFLDCQTKQFIYVSFFVKIIRIWSIRSDLDGKNVPILGKYDIFFMNFSWLLSDKIPATGILIRMCPS